jgi:hypothetical protein
MSYRDYIQARQYLLLRVIQGEAKYDKRQDLFLAESFYINIQTKIFGWIKYDPQLLADAWV